MAKTHRILVIDDPRELPLTELEEFKRNWQTKGVDFVRLDSNNPKADDRRQAFVQLRELEKKHGAIDGVVSLQGYLHRYKPINEDFLDALPNVHFITGGGAGYDNIDGEALSKRKVFYSNTPVAVSTPTADSASVLILSTLKNTVHGDRNVRRGQWTTGVPKGLNPKGAVLGVLGMGSIGRIVAHQLQAFGMEIIYHNRHRLSAEDEAGAKYVSDIADFLSRCDVLSIHVPLSDATRHLISKTELSQMKKGSRLVNTARGPVVDEQALVEALQSGHLSGAGLDVFEEEPKVHPWLLEADNVLLQPHTGSYTEGTFAEVTREMLGNLDSYLTLSEGQPPRNAINASKGASERKPESTISTLMLKLRLVGQ